MKTEENLRAHEAGVAVGAYDVPCELRQDEEYLIRNFFPEAPSRVLDLGCGNGRTTVPLARQGYDVIGVDYSASLLKLARAQHPTLSICQADVRALPFREHSFEAVFFSWNGMDYMHPLSERRRALREVWRVLQVGGVFLFSSHNVLGWMSRLSRPWQARRTLRFLADQVPIHGWIMQWYFRWRDAALGLPVFHSAPPSVQVRMLRREGWEVRTVRSVAQPDRTPNFWRDVHVAYVCVKPPSPLKS